MRQLPTRFQPIARSRVAAILFSFAPLAVSPRAHADDAGGGGGLMVHALQFAMPNEFGSDHLPETRPLVRVVWSNQFPFGVLGTHGGLWRHERQAPAARHRVVFAIGKRLFGAKAYDVRGGYRYRTWHWRGVAGFAGLGMAYDNNAGPWRAALSPELGLHVGRPRLFFPGFQLRVQGDLYTSAPHAHGLVTVGYTFM